MKKSPLKPLDIPAIVLAAALAAAAGAAAHSGGASSSRVTIRGADKTWTFPLDAEELARIPGPLGETVVEIRGGRASILASPCGEQTCVAAGALCKNGQWAACLPNRVFLLVEGPAAGGVDGEVDAGSW